MKCGAFTALVFLFTPPTWAQNTNEVQRLRKEIESLKKENELLKRESDLLKRENELAKNEAKAKPDKDGDSKSGSQSRRRVLVGGLEIELLKCVRDRGRRDRVTFTFSAQCDNDDRRNLNQGGGHGGLHVNLTARDGESL